MRRSDVVLFVTDNLRVGGAQRSLVNLLNELPAKWNRRLLCLTPSPDLGFDNDLNADDRRSLTILATADPAQAVEAVLRVVDREGIGTVCFWNAQAQIKVPLAQALRSLGGVAVVEVSPGPMLFKELLAAGPESGDKYLFAQNYLDHLDLFIAKYKRGHLFPGLTVNRANKHRVANGVDLHDLSQIQRIQAGRRARSRKQGELRAVTRCRFCPTKKLHVLLQAAALVRDKLPDFMLTIFGTPELRWQEYWQECQQLIADLRLEHTILFPGHSAELVSDLSGQDVFIMLSTNQGCPNASLEAMACSLPVIANDNGGTREQVLHHQTGLLLASLEPEELADALMYLARHPQQIVQMGESARGHVAQNFNMRRMVQGYQRLLWPTLQAPDNKPQPV